MTGRFNSTYWFKRVGRLVYVRNECVYQRPSAQRMVIGIDPPLLRGGDDGLYAIIRVHPHLFGQRISRRRPRTLRQIRLVRAVVNQRFLPARPLRARKRHRIEVLEQD